MSTSTWITDGEGDWADPQNWSPVAIPGPSSDVAITVGIVVASASIGTVNSIANSSSLRFQSAGTNTVTTFLDNSGGLRVDRKGGAGGTILNIAGALINSGSLRVGNATLSAPDEVTAASLDNKGGGIRLLGSSANQTLLDVTAGSAGFGAAGTLSGYVRLAGDSAIEFASGEITSLAAKAQLDLNGSDAFIEDSTALGSNSALTGLASIGSGAIFGLQNKAAMSTTGSLSNDGFIRLDYAGGDGGASLTVAGTLTNSGTLGIGAFSGSDKVTAASLDNTGSILLNKYAQSNTNQALLDVTGSAGFGASGVLSGHVDLFADSAIEFASGEITGLAGSLTLNGNEAFIEDSAALGSNSALTGLANVAGTLGLEDGTSVSTTGALVNDGLIRLDLSGDGGSSLTVAGTLNNSGSLYLGNASLSAPAKATATSLDNTGSISLRGSRANQALLDVTASAGFGTAGTLTGAVSVGTDSAIEFASGQISTIAKGATLFLVGNSAFIEDSTALGSNSALAGLASIGDSARLYLTNKAAVSTTGALVNDGTVGLDDVTGGEGGSSLTLAGALDNSSELVIGNTRLSASDKVTAPSLDNTGLIGLRGSSANQALLDVTAGVAGFGMAGVLNGDVRLAGDSAIEFASGQITSLGAHATLNLNGNDAFIEDSTALGSNSALTGLASIGVGATFDLENKASLSTSGALANNGTVYLDNGVGGGSTLSIGGTLTNTGTLDIGNDSLFSISSSVTANSFVNSGTVDLIGQGPNFAALDVSGATTNNGSISITNDTEELAGAVGGVGSFSLSQANLQFDSSVSAGQTITEGGVDTLTLKQAQSFAATISGFGTGDTIDATNFLAPPATTYNFVENSGGTGGTLTLHDASLIANILMTGHYSNSNFTLAPDHGTGTLVKFV